MTFGYGPAGSPRKRGVVFWDDWPTQTRNADPQQEKPASATRADATRLKKAPSSKRVGATLEGAYSLVPHT